MQNFSGEIEEIWGQIGADERTIGEKIGKNWTLISGQYIAGKDRVFELWFLEIREIS